MRFSEADEMPHTLFPKVRAKAYKDHSFYFYKCLEKINKAFGLFVVVEK